MYVIYLPQSTKYIAIDSPSGGYPYATEWYRAQFWTEKEEALKYMAIWKNKFHEQDMTLWDVELTMREQITDRRIKERRS